MNTENLNPNDKQNTGKENWEMPVLLGLDASQSLGGDFTNADDADGGPAPS